MPDPVLPKRFRFIRELGQGGMGVVYEALDVEQGARVAVKTMRDLTAESLARFKAEFRALADLHHPNIVTLGELLSEGTGWFFTMELVEGSDFLAYVRPGEARLRAAEALAPARRPSEAPLALAPTLRLEGKQPSYDEGRLRSALRQLTEALSAMHAAGVIHRDIKPSNIRVTPAGRLVVLDFGLATDSATGASIGGAIRGTPAYMAPEQGISGSVGPAADWYSVGVVLYEAITGVVPLEGPPLQVLLRKQSHIPEPPRAHVPDVPVDLDALCCRLLSVDPSLRPTTADVQRALGTAETCEASASRSSLLDQGGFVGRAKELAALRDAFDESRSQALSVLVEGESGVGKSCVVKRFVSTLGAELPDLVVLAGRCYEREELPYKALDGVVDALVRVLLRSGNELAERIIPTRPGPLAQVFPVLRRVGAFAKAARDPVTRADPVDLRNRAFAAMREMLARLASIRPCVVIIDDLQWADADSFALLEAIMRPPDEPALLLVATVRVAPLGESTAMQKVTGLLSFARSVLAGRTRTIAMLPMPEEDARALTIRLLARGAPGGPQSIEAIAREAGGHPLFIDALVRHSAVAGAGSGGTKLEDALWSRVAGLAVGVRRVMQILAVAGGPITQDVLAAAFGEDRSELGRHVALLRAEHLASSTGARMTDTLEPYHDRVRSAVLANISDEDRAACHRALAVALERAPRRETEALARHWRGAGDTAQAARYSALAAHEAAGTLAFDHAVALYETAIELGPRAGDERSALLEKLGDSLSSAGRGERAAVAYAEASRGAQAARSLDLQRRGADQLLRAGHFDEGLAAIGRVLGSIGLRLPRTPLSALLFLRRTAPTFDSAGSAFARATRARSRRPISRASTSAGRSRSASRWRTPCGAPPSTRAISSSPSAAASAVGSRAPSRSRRAS